MLCRLCVRDLEGFMEDDNAHLEGFLSYAYQYNPHAPMGITAGSNWSPPSSGCPSSPSSCSSADTLALIERASPFP